LLIRKREAAINTASTDVQYWYYVGLYYHTIVKNLLLAEKYYLMTIELYDYAISMNNLANIYHLQKDYAKMHKYYLMAIGKGYIKAMVNYAKYYILNGNIDITKIYAFMALQQDETHAEVLNLIGTIYIIEQNYNLGIQYLQEGVEYGSAECMFKLGLCYKHCQKPDMAIKYFEMACHKKHCESMYELGIIYQYIHKNFCMAQKYYLLALSISPKFILGNIKLGELYYNNKNYTEAKSYYLSAIDSFNDFDIMHMHNDYNEILKWMPIVWFHLGVCYHILGQISANQSVCQYCGLYGYKCKGKCQIKYAKKYYQLAIYKSQKPSDSVVENSSQLLPSDFTIRQSLHKVAINGALINLANIYHMERDYYKAKTLWLITIVEYGNIAALKNIVKYDSMYRPYMVKLKDHITEMAKLEPYKLTPEECQANQLFECPICMNAHKTLYTFDCGHGFSSCKFHATCLTCYQKITRCPICRYLKYGG